MQKSKVFVNPENIARALGSPKRTGDGWLALCPCHADKNPSLSITSKAGRLLVHCHADCSQEAVISALKARGLWPEPDPAEAPIRPRGVPAELDGARFTQAWEYRDARGNRLGYVVRFDGPKGKEIRPFFKPEGENWRVGGAPKPWPLYRLDVLAAHPEKNVLICEGEKAAEAAHALMPDYVATTTLHGAKAPQNADFSPLKGRRILLWPDNDEPGLQYAKTVRSLALAAGAAEVKILDPSRLDLPEKGDAADWPAGKPLPDPLPILEADEEDMEAADDEGEGVVNPTLPPWPLEVFPGLLRTLIVEVSRSFAAPVETVSAVVLSVLAACVGRTRSIYAGRDWYEPAILWIANMAPSGVGKTPVMNFLLRPIFKREREWFDKYKQELAEYEAALEKWRATKADSRGVKPTPPSHTQLLEDDATVESLTNTLAENPRGVLWCRDELSGLLLDFDRYAQTQGGTKARLLSAYDAGPWKVSRVSSSRKAFVAHAAVSVLGGVQPQTLPQIFSNADTANGFLPRFQFVFSTRKDPPKWTDARVSDEAKTFWNVLINHLLTLDFDPDGNPQVVDVSSEAREIFVEWHNDLATLPWRDPDGETLEPFAAKIRARALRLALILHQVDCFLDLRVDYKTPVSADTMRRALVLCDVLFQHQKHALAFMTPRGPRGVLSPLHERIAEAIVALEDRIEHGLIPTAEVAEKLNSGADKRFHVTPDAVGRSVKKLGLYVRRGHVREKRSRCVVVSPHDIERLKILLNPIPSVPSVPSVPNVGNTTDCGRDTYKTQVSQVSHNFSDEGVHGTLGTLDQTSVPPAARMNKEKGTHGTLGTLGTLTSEDVAQERSDMLPRRCHINIPRP